MRQNFVTNEFSTSYFNSIVWQAWENNSEEDCPPFGLVAFRPHEGADEKFTQVKSRTANADEAIFDGTQPNEYTEAMQHPSLLGVNGDTTVKSGGDAGQCSFVWPALVYLDADTEELEVGQPCGPVEGSWSVSARGDAFIFLGHEPVATGGSVSAEVRGDTHLGWVAINHHANDRDVVKVRNDTGGDLEKGDVVSLDGVVMDNITESQILFKGVQPTTDEKPYGVLLSNIPDGKIGRVQLSGVCRAKIDNISGSHLFAHITSGDSQLQTDTNGQAQILFKEEVESQWWAVVRLSNYRSGDGGGHSVIRFRVLSLAPYTDEVSSPCEAVIAEVLSVSCLSSSVAVGDEVTIYDPSACWFNVPIEVLEGASGQAVLMEAGVYEQVPDCVEASEENCWWLVQHLCCTEELYAD